MGTECTPRRFQRNFDGSPQLLRIPADSHDMTELRITSTSNSPTNVIGWRLAPDAITRRAQYNSYIQQGLSEMEATLMALESMNFNKRGLNATVQYASRMIPFFNAQIQGLSVLFKAATGNMPAEDVLKIKRKFFNNAMMLTGFGIAYAMAMDDDDYYPPERIAHAVSMLQSHPKALCAGASEIYIYFKHITQMVQFGPYGPNHATAGTFAFKRELLKNNAYDEKASLAEEKSFLKDYTVPFVQLEPKKTILVFSHIHNTFDKKKLLDNRHPNFVLKQDRFQ